MLSSFLSPDRKLSPSLLLILGALVASIAIPILTWPYFQPLPSSLAIVDMNPSPATCTASDLCKISVKMKWDGSGGASLYVLLIPSPTNPDMDWWVQALPYHVIDRDWVSDPVYIGLPGDASGLPFRICAVATNEILPRGGHWPQRDVTRWQKMEDCWDVTRGS